MPNKREGYMTQVQVLGFKMHKYLYVGVVATEISGHCYGYRKIVAVDISWDSKKEAGKRRLEEESTEFLFGILLSAQKAINNEVLSLNRSKHHMISATEFQPR